MSKFPIFTISLKGISVEEKKQLISILESNSWEIQSDTNRLFGIDDVVELVAVISGLIVLGEKATQYAQALYNWLKKRKDAGKKTEGQLKHPNPKIKPLDLENATEEEIKQWIEEVAEWLQSGKK